jgi:hypothetical protein
VISVWGDLLGLVTVCLTVFEYAFSHIFFVLACFLLKDLISCFECLSVTKHCFSLELFSERTLLLLNSSC